MALFAIQLVRFVLSTMLPAETEIQLDVGPATAFQLAFEIVVGMHEMFNVNIKSIYFYFFCFADDIYVARASHQQ